MILLCHHDDLRLFSTPRHDGRARRCDRSDNDTQPGASHPVLLLETVHCINFTEVIHAVRLRRHHSQTHVDSALSVRRVLLQVIELFPDLAMKATNDASTGNSAPLWVRADARNRRRYLHLEVVQAGMR